jgi:bifunctional UDP-N-acetylglucosamine pyrophosphorylase/glucosamine-1-phosphate N-acetyltransferase
MKSRLAKVLHPLLGWPMLRFPVEAAQAVGLDVTLVVHHQADLVREAMAGRRVAFALQETPRGTGDAVASGLAALPESGLVVVMAGDAPLFRAETLQALLDAHDAQAWVTVLTAVVEDAGRYGRLVRDADGAPCRIVEASEASPEELAIQEINTGAYVFDIEFLRRSLPTLKPHAHKSEIYLTDVLEIAAAEGRARARIHGDVAEIMGVNDRWALSEARAILQERVLRSHALSGVTFEDPSNTVVEMGVDLAQDVVIGPGVVLREGTRVGEGSTVGPACLLQDATVGSDVEILAFSSLESAVVEDGARIGPYARLRPGAHIGPEARVGNFVEIKKSSLGRGAKANHLSYIGDASVGAGANVGAGTITCNYDGYLKHRTEIGDGAFIGSNSALVAPVKIGDGALVGAGAVVVSDVPEDSIAVARGEQKNLQGAARRFREKRKAAKEALKSDESS